MSKVIMECVRCHAKPKWYKRWWPKIHEEKISETEFLCKWCSNHLKLLAVAKFVRNYKKNRGADAAIGVTDK